MLRLGLDGMQKLGRPFSDWPSLGGNVWRGSVSTRRKSIKRRRSHSHGLVLRPLLHSREAELLRGPARVDSVGSVAWNIALR